MTAGLVQLSESAQTLVDNRLDTIDRMLVGRLARQERLAIVREVESQIYELLAESSADEPGRADVLAVLARLDPPEAYLPEETTGEPQPRREDARPQPSGHARPAPSFAAKTSGALGLLALAAGLCMPGGLLIGELLGSKITALVLTGGMTAFTLLCGVVGLTLGIHARKSGAWALIGVVTSTLALLFSLTAAVVFFVLLL